MTSRQQVFQTLPAVLGAGILFVTVGCGSGLPEGPPRYRVTGKVTYDGKPLPFGTITFNPDGSKQNSGPQGIAKIKDGVYDTAKGDGKGAVGGPMTVDVMGTTAEQITEGGEGRILFSSFVVQEDMPKSDTTLDVTVPKDAANPKSQRKK